MIKNLNKIIKISVVTLIVFGLFSIFTPISEASTEIYFQKDSKEIIDGDTFLAVLKISSDKMVNVIDGTIIYDKDKLEIREINIDNSLFSLWAQEPVFNNEIGELSFTGGLPNGFSGENGQVLEINFFAKKEGSSLVGFKDVFSVFLNDGEGTKINPWLKPMSVSITKKPNFFVENVSLYFSSVKKNYVYYIAGFILILLFIMYRLFIKKKNDK